MCRKKAGSLESNAANSEIRIPSYLLDTLVKGQGGSGVPPEMEDIVDLCRQQLDDLFVQQGGRRFNDAQWSIVAKTFALTD